MSQKHLRRRGKESLELIEEAVGLVRRAPVPHLAIYCIGALPFVLGTLYFWAEMSRSPFAEQHLVGETLGLGVLYLWMKTCQTAFSRCMRCQVSGEGFTFSPARLWRVFLVQAAVQPTGLFLLPVSLVLAVPFPWVYAFYQNLTALDDGEELDIRSLVKAATGQALVWPRQNHFLLLVMGAFGFFICLNLMTAFFVLPGLVKMLFGIETVFTRSGLSLLNSTFFAATLALAYLCVDPIIKTMYALRCFYGESRNSGADLKAELHRTAAAPLAAVTATVLLLLVCGSRTFAAQQTSADATFVEAQAQRRTDAIGSQVPSAELDRTIQLVIQQPKYAWREPRKKLISDEAGQSGLLRRFFERIKPFLIDSLKAIGRWLDALFRRLFGRQRSGQSGDAAQRWVIFLHVLVYTLIAATAAGLVWLFYWIWKKRHQGLATTASQPLQPIPDLSDDNLGAEQLPEESWLKLAHELLAKGELRLALRAFYLASLAYLAANHLIQLARFKSNLDYERELRRRAHALPGLLNAFGENLRVFDRVWYGLHEVQPDQVNQFAQNVQNMRSAAGDSPPVPRAA